MLAVPGATAPPQNLQKIIFETKTLFSSVLTRHKPCLLIAPKLPRPRDLTRTTRRVGAIETIAIAAFAALGLRVLPRPWESTQLRPRLKTIAIEVAAGQRVIKIRTWARPPVTTITRKVILPTNALSFASNKTSIALGNLLVGAWY